MKGTRKYEGNQESMNEKEDLLKRIEVLEDEMAAIRWQLLPAVVREELKAAEQSPNKIRKMTKGRRIDIHLSDAIKTYCVSTDATKSGINRTHTKVGIADELHSCNLEQDSTDEERLKAGPTYAPTIQLIQFMILTK